MDSKQAGHCPVTGHGQTPLADMTLSNPKIGAQPNAYYQAMRVEDPVHYDEKLGMWLVSRYDDIVTVLRDPLTYSDKHGYAAQYASGFFQEFKAILERDGGGFFPDAIKDDPPAHTRVRRLLDKAFTAHRVATLEPGITAIITRLIEQLADKAANGQVVDGVNDFAIPLTISVICEQLGISQFNSGKIQRWSSAVTAQIGRMQNREQMLDNAAQICDLQNFIIAEMKARETEPREDMISDLVHATLDDGSKLTFAEAVSLIRALIIAGNDTTATAIGNLLFVLATRPEVATALQASVDDERLMNRFVEELLRIEPPVRGLAKMTTREIELGGRLLPKDAHLLVLYASGNDDETQFTCPRNFDLNRSNIGKHVAFGVGVHRCVGASLSRMEIKVAAREVVRRLADIKLAVPVEQIRYQPTVAVRSIERLPLTFTRR
ncbi:MAG: cytochrome [Hydrocarboniphaga sp.]|uniref:cytochrome P450 n=1 Tax=Hydrocarboniphaga sp. TaxID=2033016 RepID=UPI002607AEB0|nr:cytochrome P450 [Hydrocarboniphaga sp.]MDB5972191.1 cytochrome [Hydrocarboniphaga sp.]